jgi:hypothetical protein
MAEPCKSRVQQLLQDGLKSTKNYLSEHVDAKFIVEQAQRNVLGLARKAEQRFHEVTGRKEQQQQQQQEVSVFDQDSFVLLITEGRIYFSCL